MVVVLEKPIGGKGFNKTFVDTMFQLFQFGSHLFRKGFEQSVEGTVGIAFLAEQGDEL